MKNMQRTKKDMELLKQEDVGERKMEELIDIKNICVDVRKPVSDRVNDFLEKIKNPYCFRVGNIAVKVEFEETGITLEEKLEQLLEHQS